MVVIYFIKDTMLSGFKYGFKYKSIYEPWPKLKIEPIKVDLHQLIVGWTGVSQSSETFIEQFNTFTANNCYIHCYTQISRICTSVN